MENQEYSAEQNDDWDDPLAVEVGLGVGADDLPAEGWPDTFRPDIVKRVLGYLPE